MERGIFPPLSKSLSSSEKEINEKNVLGTKLREEQPAIKMSLGMCR